MNKRKFIKDFVTAVGSGLGLEAAYQGLEAGSQKTIEEFRKKNEFVGEDYEYFFNTLKSIDKTIKNDDGIVNARRVALGAGAVAGAVGASSLNNTEQPVGDAEPKSNPSEDSAAPSTKEEDQPNVTSRRDFIKQAAIAAITPLMGGTAGVAADRLNYNPEILDQLWINALNRYSSALNSIEKNPDKLKDVMETIQDEDGFSIMNSSYISSITDPTKKIGAYYLLSEIIGHYNRANSVVAAKIGKKFGIKLYLESPETMSK